MMEGIARYRTVKAVDLFWGRKVMNLVKPKLVVKVMGTANEM